ncbi:MAG: hypothetical protein PHZ04_00260 [Patescibacteria group bacterium]|nr:hypothetical protein [Patescibacteria group bacterium]MDD5555040.1 hypothetical protein [Patescibacteria group bacterium]
MFDYLQKFNKLPKNLRDKVSTPPVMAAINELEKKYGVNLASTVMKVMVKEIRLSDLTDYFIEKENVEAGTAGELAKLMAERIFVGVKDYLGAEAGGQGERVFPPFNTVRDGQVQDKKESPAKAEAEKEAAPIVKGASFFFSPEDEEEIRELTKKIDGGARVALTDEQIEDKLNKIIASAQINFGSQELSDRFRSILKTYLRGIRDRIETKQTLKKSFAGGGLGFDSDSVDEVLKITDGIAGGAKVPVRPPGKIRLPEDGLAGRGAGDKTAALKNIGVRDVDYSFSSLAAMEEKGERARVKLDVSHEIAPPPPAIAGKKTVEEPVKITGPSRTETKIPVNPAGIIQKPDATAPLVQEIKRPAAKAPLRTPTPITSAGKKKMEDVKYVPPRVMNPIDELRYMDLVNFRRLSPEAGKQVAKIKEKINLLEEENYSRRIEGIKGWRQSPVNKLYLSIGQQSISESKPVDVIIEERRNAGQDYLSMEEFKAIMDLNKELRF